MVPRFPALARGEALLYKDASIRAPRSLRFLSRSDGGGCNAPHRLLDHFFVFTLPNYNMIEPFIQIHST
jgi:hypothetical protein